LDDGLLSSVFSTFPVVATVEEHSLIGGFGGAVAEWMADQPPLKSRLCRIGSPDIFQHHTGSQAFVRNQIGLTPRAIAERVKTLFHQN
jgi:transketolase